MVLVKIIPSKIQFCKQIVKVRSTTQPFGEYKVEITDFECPLWKGCAAAMTSHSWKKECRLLDRRNAAVALRINGRFGPITTIRRAEYPRFMLHRHRSAWSPNLRSTKPSARLELNQVARCLLWVCTLGIRMKITPIINDEVFKCGKANCYIFIQHPPCGSP